MLRTKTSVFTGKFKVFFFIPSYLYKNTTELTFTEQLKSIIKIMASKNIKRVSKLVDLLINNKH